VNIMHIPKMILACSALAIMLGGCATFGTNVEGDFSCRAPKGTCAPTHVIDAAAAPDRQLAAEVAAARVRAGVEPGDTERTSERTLKVVFPAHVDESGVLHDQAIAWTVIERPRWAAELRRKSDSRDTSLIRQLKRQLRERKDDVPVTADDQPPSAAPSDADDSSPFSLMAPDPAVSSFSLPVASPLVLPSTAREAVAGAKAPAVEGFDMPPPHDRTPRPQRGAQTLQYPTAEAIDAAKSTGAVRAQQEQK
jgi:conjugal transfer pilus assembly protein TraV